MSRAAELQYWHVTVHLFCACRRPRSCRVHDRSPQVLFGLRGEEASAEASVMAADTLRWAPATARAAAPAGAAAAAAQEPQARLSHAAACVRERVFVFGGMTGDGRLLGDLWSLDLDSMQWTPHFTSGATPCARKGVLGRPRNGAQGRARAALGAASFGARQVRRGASVAACLYPHTNTLAAPAPNVGRPAPARRRRDAVRDGRRAATVPVWRP